MSEEELTRLQPLEKKRQDVVNGNLVNEILYFNQLISFRFAELFHTERSHVRNLKVLNLIFWKRLSTHKLLKNDEMSLIFSNLNELLQIHITFNTNMKQKRKEEAIVRNVGDLLLRMVSSLQFLSFSF